MVLSNDFSFLKKNEVRKANERGLVRSVIIFTTILGSGEGNDRPMCKLGVRVNLLKLTNHGGYLIPVGILSKRSTQC